MKLENPEEKYRKTNTTIFNCKYHVIFCPRYRKKILVGNIKTFLEKEIIDLCTSKDCKVIEMEIMPDHIHLLLDVNPDFGIKSLVSRIKACTARKMYREFPDLRKKSSIWTRSKFIATVGSVSLDVVKKYIQEQNGIN